MHHDKDLKHLGEGSRSTIRRLLCSMPLGFGLSPFFVVALYAYWDRPLAALAAITVIASTYGGILLGNKIGVFAGRVQFFAYRGINRRLSAGLAAFFFLFMPVFLYVQFFEGRTDFRFDHQGIVAHFIWAALGGLAFFSFEPTKPTD